MKMKHQFWLNLCWGVLRFSLKSWKFTEAASRSLSRFKSQIDFQWQSFDISRNINLIVMFIAYCGKQKDSTETN